MVVRLPTKKNNNKHTALRAVCLLLFFRSATALVSVSLVLMYIWHADNAWLLNARAYNALYTERAKVFLQRVDANHPRFSFRKNWRGRAYTFGGELL